ncbi:hypothetical protein LAZ67_14001496 [Cordylochernes scorpioides]|uniref:Uncharacterized protein n=1 Tax=Cordylochernes scorpioides TaxID=51811 RepID=A0ABY6L632_9ARAC|nr:hypothetical protein LAZ67_14001496 [Cordylochernes scorpioides]
MPQPPYSPDLAPLLRRLEKPLAQETSTLEGPGPGDERVLHRFSEPNLDKVAINSQLCRRQDGKGVVLKAGPAEDPSLQVRGPPYDVEGLSNERPDGGTAPVTVAEGAVDGPAGRTGGADRGRMGRMGQGVEGQLEGRVGLVAREGAAPQRGPVDPRWWWTDGGRPSRGEP